MIYYLKIIWSILLFFNIILKVVLILILIYCIIYLRRYLRNYVITINEIRIKYMVFYVLNTILFVLFYICLLGYWRFLNTNKNLDLKSLIYRCYTFLSYNNIYDTIILIICFICFMIFFYYLIIFLRKYFIFHFLKLDIFITYISQFEDFFEQTNYDNFIFKFTYFISFYSHFVYKPIEFFCKLYLNYFNKEYNNIEYKKKNGFLFDFSWNIQNKLNLPKHADKFPIYMILCSIIYDILYNNMVLNKLYYISFLLFFYYLIRKSNDFIGMLYKGDSIFIYRYLYEEKELYDWDEYERQERITHINKDFIRIENRGKSIYATDYDEKRLIKLSWSTYLCLINILILIYIFYIRNIEIIINNCLFNNIILISVLSICIILWFFITNKIIENVFLIISSIVVIIWLMLFINHNVPLLFHETLLETSYIKIIDNFTIEEKVLFLKEYFFAEIQYLNINKRLHLFELLRIIPYYDLLQTSTISEIKEYITNLIETYEYLENNIYPSLKDNIPFNNE